VLIDSSIIHYDTVYVYISEFRNCCIHHASFFPCTIRLVLLRGGIPMREREGGRKKESLSAMSSTTIFRIQNDDDDGRRSGICSHSTCIDEMFIFISSECKYFVYTYSHCIKREDWTNRYKTRKSERASLHFQTVYKYT